MKNNYVFPHASLRKKIGIAAIALFAFSQTFNAQNVRDYGFVQSTGVFESILTTGTVVPNSEASTGTTYDTTGWNVALPFDFNYNGTNYNSIYVNSNGGATFGVTNTGAALLTNTTTYTNGGAIGVMNRDLWGVFITSGETTSGSNVITNVASFKGIEIGKTLNNVNGIPSGTTITGFDEAARTITMSNPATSSAATAVIRYGTGKILTKVEGTAPNRVFVIEWYGYNDYGTTVALSNFLNFQLRLSEGTNYISMVYGPGYSVNTSDYSNQVGLRGVATSDYNNRVGSLVEGWSNTTRGTANNTTNVVHRNNSVVPTPGLTFTWTPPLVCSSIPVAGTVSPATQNVLVNQTPSTLTLSGYSSGLTSLAFQWQVSTDNVNFTDITTGGDALTYTPPAFDGVTRYYRCVVTCTATNQSSMTAAVVVEGCTPVTSFSEDFDSVIPQAFPSCWAKIGTTGSAYTQALTTMSAPNALYMYSSSTAASNLAHVSMPPVSTLQTGLYQLRFKLRANSSTGGTIQVGYLATPGDVASFVSIGGNYVATSTSQPVEYIVRDLNAPAGVTSLVFKHTGSSAASLYIDDVFYELMPTCLEPTAVTTTSTAATTADLSWTAPSTVPGVGYQVYYSTTNTAPTATTVLDTTNSVTTTATSIQLTGLQPSTQYFAWVRTVCSASDMSVWTPTSVMFRTECLPPVVTATDVTFCPGMPATLTATSNGGANANINWYDSASSTTPIATGATFVTPALTTATNYYVGASIGGVQTVGHVQPAGVGVVSTSNFAIATYYQIFNVTSPLTFNSVDVYPTSGTPVGTSATIEIRDNTGALLVSAPYTVTANDGVTPNRVNINYTLMPGTGYRIGQGAPSINLNRNTSGSTYPYVYNGIEITGNNFSSGVDYWYYVYNWQVTVGCEGVRQMVTATPDAAACLGVSEIGAKKEEVKLYPNPFTDVLNISDVKNVKSINIVDLSGKLIKTINKPTTTLELSDLTSGMYMVVINKVDDSKQTIKVVKK